MKRFVTYGLGLAVAALLLAGNAEAQQTGTITGQVVDDANQRPLAGVQVYVPGANVGTITRSDGRYVLLNVPAGEVEIWVQLIGYATPARTVTLAADETVVADFALRQEVLGLDEIVVTGVAGQARRRELGNTVTQISMERIIEPVTSIDNLLSGRSTAMTVNPGSGTMGQGAAIRLRGNTTVRNNQPLVFVDGVRQGSEAYPLSYPVGVTFWQTPQSQAGPLNDINPADIERIEIIKGPAAATVYGSEAASGVIQIFTRRGREGRATWTYQTNQRFSRMQAFGPDVPIQHYRTDGTPYPADTPMPATNWKFVQMDPFLRTGWTQQHNLSVTGGTQAARYFLSAALDDGEGVHPNDEETRVTVRGNLTFQPLTGLSIDWNTAYTNHDFVITHSGNNLYGIHFNAMRTPGNTVGSTDPDVIGRLLDAWMEQENTRFNTGVTATYAPTANFTNRLTVGMDRATMRGFHLTPFDYILLPQGSLAELWWRNQAVSLYYTGTYNFRISEVIGSTLSWGGQNVTTESKRVDAYGLGLPGPGNHTITAAASKLSASSANRVIDAGFFAENRFSFRDKLYLTVGARVDGNSTFGEDMGLLVYPKSSVSYVISEEDFWPQRFGDLRLRAALGEAGRAPGPFDAQRTWSPQAFAGQAAFLPGNMGNPELGPERTLEIEGGFESSLLDDRLTVDFTYYHQTTRDGMLFVPQVPSGGFIGSQLENIGKYSNQGMELSLNGTLISRREFTWDLGLNLTTNKSEMLDTKGQEYYNYQVGHPIGANRGTKVLNPNEYADPITERDYIFGPNAPTRIVGLSTDLGLPWGIRVSARGDYQGGNYITQSSQWAMANRGGGAPGCAEAYLIVPHRGWRFASEQSIAQLTAHQRGHCYNDNLATGMWIEPADFFKIREISVAVPVDFALPMANSAVMSFSARNIRVWTHEEFTAFDPEMIWNRASISSVFSGIAEAVPSPMQFTASLRVVF